MEKTINTYSPSSNYTQQHPDISSTIMNIGKLAMTFVVVGGLSGCGERARMDIQKATGAVGSGVTRALDFVILDTPTAAGEIGADGLNAGYHLGKAGYHTGVDGGQQLYDSGTRVYDNLVGNDSSNKRK